MRAHLQSPPSDPQVPGATLATSQEPEIPADPEPESPMRHRPLTLAAAGIAAATVLMPTAASAAAPFLSSDAAPVTEFLSRRTYDSTPERTEASWRIDGATAGPLGGYLDLTATARDGSLPTGLGECEEVSVSAVLTVSPGETLTVHTHRGEACVHQFGGTLSLNAAFRNRHVTYEGTEHGRVRVVGDGLLSAGEQFLGAQASFNASVRW